MLSATSRPAPARFGGSTFPNLWGTRYEPFDSTTMGAKSISPGSPHVRCTPMRALSTCGEPDEIKKHTHPKHITAPLHAQAPGTRTALSTSRGAAGGATRALNREERSDVSL